MPPAPLHSTPTCCWRMRASVVLFCCLLFSGMWSVSFIYFPSHLPSEIQKLPPHPPVRGFPGVWELPLLRLPSWNGSPSLTLLSLFLSFIFCSTSFRRQWAAFPGFWCPLLAIRSCFVEFAQRSSELLMNFGGRKWSPRPFFHHLSSISCFSSFHSYL